VPEQPVEVIGLDYVALHPAGSGTVGRHLHELQGEPRRRTERLLSPVVPHTGPGQLSATDEQRQQPREVVDEPDVVGGR